MSKIQTCNRGCSDNWDVRCCCELNCPSKNSNKQFYSCPQKINTFIFMCYNEYDIYKMIENNDLSFLKKYKFTKFEKDLIKQMINDKQNENQ